MTWKLVHLLAASVAATFLIFLFWELCTKGSLMLPARSHPEPMSAASSVTMLVMFSLLATSAIRGMRNEGGA